MHEIRETYYYNNYYFFGTNLGIHMINAHYSHKIYLKKIGITVEYKTSIKRIQILITYVFLNKGGLSFS